MKEKFSPEERRIITALYMAHKPLSTYAVAEQAEMAWQTAKKYLSQLHKRGYVRHGRYGKSIYWWLKV